MGLDKFEGKLDSNPVFAARYIYEISEYALVESITQAFIANAQFMYSGFYCNSGRRYMLRYVEEGFKLLGLDKASDLVRKDFEQYYSIWHEYLNREPKKYKDKLCYLENKYG